MELSTKEIIQFAVGFNKLTNKYLVDESINDIVARKFIEEGYALVDEKAPKRYVLSEKGVALITPYIEQIFTQFIKFIKDDNFDSFTDVSVSWLSKEYKIDSDTAENLYYFLTYISEKYGYKVFSVKKENTKGLHFEKII